MADEIKLLRCNKRLQQLIKWIIALIKPCCVKVGSGPRIRNHHQRADPSLSGQEVTTSHNTEGQMGDLLISPGAGEKGNSLCASPEPPGPQRPFEKESPSLGRFSPRGTPPPGVLGAHSHELRPVCTCLPLASCCPQDTFRGSVAQGHEAEAPTPASKPAGSRGQPPKVGDTATASIPDRIWEGSSAMSPSQICLCPGPS